MKNLFFSLLLCNFILAVCVSLLGVTALFLPFQFDFYEPLLNLIDDKPWIIPVSGFGASCIAFFILFWSLKLLKSGRFIRVKGSLKYQSMNSSSKSSLSFFQEEVSRKAVFIFRFCTKKQTTYRSTRPVY